MGLAINYVYGLEHLFTDIKEINSGVVAFGDSSKIEVKGKDELFY